MNTRKMFLTAVALIIISFFVVPNVVESNTYNTKIEDVICQFVPQELKIEINSIVEDADFERNYELLFLAQSYHNGELDLTEEEIVEMKEEVFNRLEIGFDTIKYLVTEFGYPHEAVNQARKVLNIKLLEVVDNVVAISQLDVEIEEKADALIEALGGSFCESYFLFFFFSILAALGSIGFLIINLLLGLVAPAIAVILFILLGIPAIAIGIFAIIVFLVLLGIIPLAIVLCLLGV